MKVFCDRQVRYFFSFLVGIIFAAALAGVMILVNQESAARTMYLTQNRNIVSSLLEQGVPQDVIAKAVTSKSGSPGGEALLGKIGITGQTASELLLPVMSYRRSMMYLLLIPGIVIAGVLLAGSFFFFQKRENLYRQALDAVKHFMEGDYTVHLPRMKEGMIYQLFSAVDQMAMALRAKGEAEKKAKVFLRSTISDISHQLKTPLAALGMYNEIMSEEPENTEIVVKFTEKSTVSLERMEQLIQALLKITRLDAGSIVFERKPCFVSDLVTRAAGQLLTRAENEGKKIIIDGPDHRMIFCDPQWTCEAVGNIVKNALDHTEDGGIIHITWEESPAMTRLSVEDNGSGIAPEDFHHIFKRFYRSRNSMDTQGVGLGLSLAKSIIEGQGGLIAVQSSLGEGTVFTLSFLTES